MRDAGRLEVEIEPWSVESEEGLLNILNFHFCFVVFEKDSDAFGEEKID